MQKQVAFASGLLGIAFEPRPRPKTHPGKKSLNSEWFCTFALATQLGEPGVKDLAHSREQKVHNDGAKRYIICCNGL